MDTSILHLTATATAAVDNPTPVIQGIIDSAQAGEWLWMVGGIIMVIVWTK